MQKDFKVFKLLEQKEDQHLSVPEGLAGCETQWLSPER